MRWLHETGTEVPSGSLPAVRIFTAELELRGSIAPTGQRVTDMLLRGQDLAFLPDGASPSPEAWISVAPDDVLFVVPPPLVNPPAPPDDYQLADVRLRIGNHRIIGLAHLRDGERLDAGLARRQPFLPVTRATIASDHAEPERVDVVIVNLGRSEGLGQGGPVDA